VRGCVAGILIRIRVDQACQDQVMKDVSSTELLLIRIVSLKNK
jgi:hypothetical protein